MAAISASTSEDSRSGFGPYLPGLVKVPFGDLLELECQLSNPRVAGFLFEPIQGEAGVIVPPSGYLKKAQELCRRNHVLLIADEVQTGIARTGRLLACDWEDVHPDILILGKALSGGVFPVSAVLTNSEIMLCIRPGEHGSTFGGNPIAAAAGLAAISVIEKNRLLTQAKSFEKRLKIKISAIRGVREVRGRGLLIGIALDGEYAKELSALLAKNGFLVNAPNPETIRIAPALIVTKVQIDKFIAAFAKAMKEVNHG